MAKTYLSTVKYMIHTKFEITGLVDKHDIVGAIFGQSEGLIGEDMDLRELQKNGKIGRIEVNTNAVMGKTNGELTVPTSLDMAQTAILAAAVESIEKVGPFDSKFETLSIEDVRGEKRVKLKEVGTVSSPFVLPITALVLTSILPIFPFFCSSLKSMSSPISPSLCPKIAPTMSCLSTRPVISNLV
jgi:hypothetical protein